MSDSVSEVIPAGKLLGFPGLFITVHRWLGVVLCLFMAAWFASGAVLIYVPFPSLSTTEQMNRAGWVDASRIRFTPQEVVQRTGIPSPIDHLRLIERGDRPLYVVQVRGQPAAAFWADDGSPARLQSTAEAIAIASRFAAAGIERVDEPIDFDQWVVHQGFDLKRPYFRAHVADQARTVLYVSQSTGEVLQRTTRSQRAWNYVGAVVHWIYPTVLRRHWAAWDQVVWWLALSGIVLVIVGEILGVHHVLQTLRARRGQITLYRGWMKWHHILGLVASIFVLTWIFSGWLSMDHGRLFSMPDASTRQLDLFRGMAITEATQSVDVPFIQDQQPFQAMEFKAVAATPLVIVHSLAGSRLYTGPDLQYAGGTLPQSLIVEAIHRAWPSVSVETTETLAEDDVYRKVRQSEIPITSIRVKLADSASTWVHVDAASGDIVSVMDRSRRVYRWLYHGLHSLDFPGLANRRPLWDVVILSLLGAGFTFSVTGAYLGMRRLKRTLRRGPEILKTSDSV